MASSVEGLEGEIENALFNPQGEFSWLRKTMNDNIPRFLFRVASPRSDGESDETWVRSVSETDTATLGDTQFILDIFCNLNAPDRKRRVARMLNRHLRQLPKDGPDEFVTWTNSLLFAIYKIFTCHFHRDDQSSLEKIKIHIVDTTRFPKGTFLRDLDLIEAFQKFDDHGYKENLRGLWNLRVNFPYVSGKYLTQGSLKIGGRCQTITGRMLVDGGLYTLQPYFEVTCKRPPNGENFNWLNPILHWRTNSTTPRISLQEMREIMRALQEITGLFEPGWKFPMAAYFGALIGELPDIEGHESHDGHLFFKFFRSQELSDEGRLYTPSKVKIITSNGMPELDRVKEVFDELYNDTILREALDDVRNAELAIRSLKRKAIAGNEQDLRRLTADSNPTLNKILRNLKDIECLCDVISTDMFPEEHEN